MSCPAPGSPALGSRKAMRQAALAPCGAPSAGGRHRPGLARSGSARGPGGGRQGPQPRRRRDPPGLSLSGGRRQPAFGTDRRQRQGEHRRAGGGPVDRGDPPLRADELPGRADARCRREAGGAVGLPPDGARRDVDDEGQVRARPRRGPCAGTAGAKDSGPGTAAAGTGSPCGSTRSGPGGGKGSS